MDKEFVEALQELDQLTPDGIIKEQDENGQVSLDQKGQMRDY